MSATSAARPGVIDGLTGRAGAARGADDRRDGRASLRAGITTSYSSDIGRNVQDRPEIRPAAMQN
jgi:hypothetical protein